MQVYVVEGGESAVHSGSGPRVVVSVGRLMKLVESVVAVGDFFPIFGSRVGSVAANGRDAATIRGFFDEVEVARDDAVAVSGLGDVEGEAKGAV